MPELQRGRGHSAVTIAPDERVRMLARLRADRIARANTAPVVDPVEVWRYVVASQWHAGIDALPHVPPEHRDAVIEHVRKYREVL